MVYCKDFAAMHGIKNLQRPMQPGYSVMKSYKEHPGGQLYTRG